jgi:hypothetical protein
MARALATSAHTPLPTLADSGDTDIPAFAAPSPRPTR